MTTKVTYGKTKIYLNERLISRQGLSEDDVAEIVRLHKDRMRIESLMARSKKPETIKRLFAEWTEGQFALQRAWRFPEDANWHPSHRLPHCTCPKYDNDERIGTPYKVVNPACIIHGNGLE